MAEFSCEVGVSKLVHLKATVRVEAPNKSQAEVVARARVRAALESKVSALMITEVGQPTYQLHEAQVADGPAVA